MNAPRIVEPHENLVSIVADLLGNDWDWLHKRLVVFPGKRPAHFLRREIARRAGRAVLPPTILSIDDLVTRIAGRDRVTDIRVAGPLDAVAVLYELHNKLGTRMGGDHFRSFESFLPLGTALFEELEELMIAKLSDRAVRNAVAGVTEGNTPVIADLYESFYAALENRSLVTRAMDYAVAATNYSPNHLAEFDRIVLAGFFAFTPSENMLVRAILADERSDSVFVAGPGLAQQLKGIGLSIQTGPPPAEAPDVTFISSPDGHGQVFALARLLERSVEEQGMPDERSVIVVPNPDTLFPLLQHALSLLPSEAYNVSLGYPLERTPLFGLFHALFQALAGMQNGRLPMTDYLRVMRHPYIKSVPFGDRTDVTRTFIHVMEERLSESAGRMTVELGRIESDADLFTDAAFRAGTEGDVTVESLRQHVQSLHATLFGGWESERTVGEAARRCSEIVRFIHDRTTAQQHPFFRRFAETFLETFGTIERSLSAGMRLDRPDAVVRVVRHMLASSSVPFPGSPLHGLQVLGLLETRSLRFDTVYVLDANDDVVPGRGGKSRLLPQSVRRKLGLETVRTRDEIVEYYFTALVRGAKRVHVLYAEGNAKDRSRYVERLLWDRELASKRVDAADAVSSVRYRVVLHSAMPESVAKTPEVVEDLRRKTYSATALDAYLHCPLKFYQGQVLRLEEREEAREEIEGRDIGSLVHAVFQRLFAPWVGRALDPSGVTAAAATGVVEEEFAARFGAERTAARVLMREQITRHVQSFLSEYQRPIAERMRVEIVDLERTEEAVFGAYRFRARMDRIERRTDPAGVSTEHILDYKTGGNANDHRVRLDRLDIADRTTWKKYIRSVQLPLYALIHAANARIAPEQVSAAYVLLGVHDIDEKIELELIDRTDPAKGERLAHARRFIDALMAEIVDPETPFTPTDDPETECPRCPFADLCGTTWTKSRSRE